MSGKRSREEEGREEGRGGKGASVELSANLSKKAVTKLSLCTARLKGRFTVFQVYIIIYIII